MLKDIEIIIKLLYPMSLLSLCVVLRIQMRNNTHLNSKDIHLPLSIDSLLLKHKSTIQASINIENHIENWWLKIFFMLRYAQTLGLRFLFINVYNFT